MKTVKENPAGNNSNKKEAPRNNLPAVSNIAGIGVDIIEVSRIKKAIKKHPCFLKRIYSANEISYCTGKGSPSVRYTCLAQRFAAKEAVAKSIGKGFGRYFSFNEISVENGPDGGPIVVLSGRAKAFCKDRLINSFYISLSATQDNAVAFVIAFS
jgi:holo-[acyl-carrier protein] synthase